MKVFLSPGCDLDWFHSLSPWQHETLAAIYRQGKHLRDKTNHGSDHRWQQAGCRTRESHYGWRKRNPWRGRAARHYHEAVYIERPRLSDTPPEGEDWFIIHFIRRDRSNFGLHFAPDGVRVRDLPFESWATVESWYCYPHMTANHTAHENRKRGHAPRFSADSS